MQAIRSLSVALSALALTYAAAANAEVHATKEFESGETRPVSVAVLPAGRVTSCHW